MGCKWRSATIAACLGIAICIQFNTDVTNIPDEEPITHE